MTSPQVYYGIEIAGNPSNDTELPIDILFIHGLNGHPRKTWTHDGVFWPVDLLQHKIPQARILTFGYDARPSNIRYGSVAFIRDVAESLAHSLYEIENVIMSPGNVFGLALTFGKEAPMLIVAASLGGIICKQALVEAARKSSRVDIVARIKGILFLGTPHASSQRVNWGRTLDRIALATSHTPKLTSTPILEQSNIFDDTNEDFSIMLDDGPLSQTQIYSFYETQNTRGIGIVIDRQLTALSGFNVTKRGMDSNHFNMTKFSDPGDRNYISVEHVLAEWAHDAQEQTSHLRVRPKGASAAGSLDLVRNNEVHPLRSQSEIREPSAVVALDTTLFVDDKTADANIVPLSNLEDGLSQEVSRLMDDGNYEDAEILQRQLCMEISQEERSRLSETLAAQANLAAILGRGGKWHEAKDLQSEILQKMQDFGESNLAKMSAKVNLAFTLTNLGVFDESERLLREALVPANMRKESLKIFLTGQTSLAMVLTEQNKYPEARALLLNIWTETKDLCGTEHPDTVVALISLSIMYIRFSRNDEAEKHLNEALDLSYEVFGKFHHHTKTVLELLVRLKVRDKNWKDALHFQEKIYRYTRARKGSGNSTSRRAATEFAVLLRLSGDMKHAIEIEERELSDARNNLGDNHPETVAVAQQLVKLLLEDKQNYKAAMLQKIIDKKLIGTRGADDLHVSQAKTNFGAMNEPRRY